jgi:hypothetical protein
LQEHIGKRPFLSLKQNLAFVRPNVLNNQVRAPRWTTVQFSAARVGCRIVNCNCASGGGTTMPTVDQLIVWAVVGLLGVSIAKPDCHLESRGLRAMAKFRLRADWCARWWAYFQNFRSASRPRTNLGVLARRRGCVPWLSCRAPGLLDLETLKRAIKRLIGRRAIVGWKCASEECSEVSVRL